MRVLLADDRPLIALGVEQLLSATEYSLSGIARSGTETMALIASCDPDIVLLDSDMPNGTGFEVLARMRRDGCRQKAVLLTPGLSREGAAVVRGLGPEGVVDKRSSPDTLLECLDRLAIGETYVDPALADQIHRAPGDEEREPVNFTKRERDVLRLVGGGLRNREIADSLGVTEGTIKVYLHGIFDKADVHTRTELAVRVKELLGPDPDWDRSVVAK